MGNRLADGVLGAAAGIVRCRAIEQQKSPLDILDENRIGRAIHDGLEQVHRFAPFRRSLHHARFEFRVQLLRGALCCGGLRGCDVFGCGWTARVSARGQGVLDDVAELFGQTPAARRV